MVHCTVSVLQTQCYYHKEIPYLWNLLVIYSIWLIDKTNNSKRSQWHPHIWLIEKEILKPRKHLQTTVPCCTQTLVCFVFFRVKPSINDQLNTQHVAGLLWRVNYLHYKMWLCVCFFKSWLDVILNLILYFCPFSFQRCVPMCTQ